jgi:hypothetical protein
MNRNQIWEFKKSTALMFAAKKHKVAGFCRKCQYTTMHLEIRPFTWKCITCGKISQSEYWDVGSGVSAPIKKKHNIPKGYKLFKAARGNERLGGSIREN